MVSMKSQQVMLQLKDIRPAKAKHLPKKPFRNRGILREKCQKHAGVDNFFLQQQLLKQDIEVNALKTKWQLAEIRQKRIARQQNRPLPAPKQREDDDEDEDDERVVRESSSSIDQVFQ